MLTQRITRAHLKATYRGVCCSRNCAENSENHSARDPDRSSHPVPKKVLQETEAPTYNPELHLVHCEVEHEIPVPLVQTQTVEMANASYEDKTQPQIEIHKFVEKEIQVQWHGGMVFLPWCGYTPSVRRSWRSL